MIAPNPLQPMAPSIRELVLIGPIAPPQWGPAVRNRIMLDTLSAWGVRVIPVNTLGWSRHPLAFLGRLLRACLRHRRVFLSVSRNGRTVLLPLLWWLQRLARVRVAFLPAGGSFGEDLDRMSPARRLLVLRMLRSFDTLCVQTPALRDHLSRLGLPRVQVVPNFKVDPGPPAHTPATSNPNPLRLVFLSRVREGKGIDVMIQALDRLHAEHLPLSLHLYGIVQPDYEPILRDLLASRPYLAYKGVIEYTHVITTIASYDLMLFPSRFLTEGFPGVLADAALAGLPVIASRLPATEDIIRDGHNGLLVPPGNAEALADSIRRLARNPGERARMAAASREAGLAFSVDLVLGRLVKHMEELGWWSSHNTPTQTAR